MRRLPEEHQRCLVAELERLKADGRKRSVALKWSRYYFDFCGKYGHVLRSVKGAEAFEQKLVGKGQGEGARDEARRVVGWYLKLLGAMEGGGAGAGAVGEAVAGGGADENGREDSVAQGGVPGLAGGEVGVGTAASGTGDPGSADLGSADRDGAAVGAKRAEGWDAVLNELEVILRTRRYSPKTLKMYAGWVKKFRRFLGEGQSTAELGPPEVKRFIEHLALEGRVSASTQNQAFNALLFLYRHVLGVDIGDQRGNLRAKRKKYIPVVLSREEVGDLLGRLEYPYDLVCKVMYGCGLRISEAVALRIKDLNFDLGVITVHDGKGKKDRTVPLPERIDGELRGHLGRVKKLHARDVGAGYAGAFMFDRIEVKYPGCGKELPWQWFFPAKQLTTVVESGERRRHHLYPQQVQVALKAAVSAAQIPKRVTAHTLRHSFASHLLAANTDIRTIQELLGHGDVRTTMIYTHTVRSVTAKEARSPLDL